MQRRTILPNMLTALSLSCGLFVIFKMNMIAPGAATYQNVLAATCILLAAAVFDLMDGAVARALKVESEFGGFFDCMADAVSFGVAPCVVILKTISPAKGTLLSFLLTTGAMVFAISGVLRLVRFNVTRHEIQGDKEKMAQAKTHFTGLPIPAAAALVTSTSLLLASDEFRSEYLLPEDTKASIVALLFFLIGYLMVSKWKFPSLKSLHIRVGSFQVVFLTATLAAILLVGAMHHFALLFASIVWAYLLISLILSLVRLIAGKRIQSLDDFEPDSDEQQ